MPSFPVAAGILSYYGYSTDCRKLLQKLSHITVDYYSKHKKVLQAFLVQVPALTKLKFIGVTTQFVPRDCVYFEWPKMQDLKRMLPQDASKQREELRMTKITVRTDELNFITGVQVELANGSRSPTFRDSAQDDDHSITTIESKADITGLSLKVHMDANGYFFYEGLILEEGFSIENYV